MPPLPKQKKINNNHNNHSILVLKSELSQDKYNLTVYICTFKPTESMNYPRNYFLENPISRYQALKSFAALFINTCTLLQLAIPGMPAQSFDWNTNHKIH